MQIPDTDTPLILLALGVAMYHVPHPERVAMEELERRIQSLRGTNFEQINKDNTMSNDKNLMTVTDDEVVSAVKTIYGRDRVHDGAESLVRKALEQFAAGREGWHSAVLAECTSIGACYQESDPEKTVRDLIDWHRKDAVWHHEQEAAGRFASSQPIPDIANGLKFVIDWLEGGKDPLLAAKELRGLVAASPAPVNDDIQSLAEKVCDSFGIHAGTLFERLSVLYVRAPMPTGQAAEPAPPENQSRELDADVAAQNYCRSMWGAARGYPDWRRYHDAFVAGYMASPAPPAEMAAKDAA